MLNGKPNTTQAAPYYPSQQEDMSVVESNGNMVPTRAGKNNTPQQTHDPARVLRRTTIQRPRATITRIPKQNTTPATVVQLKFVLQLSVLKSVDHHVHSRSDILILIQCARGNQKKQPTSLNRLARYSTTNHNAPMQSISIRPV